MKNFVNSFKYAFEGIITGIKTQRNMKIHIIMMGLVIIAGIIFKISKMEWIVCLILFGLVISLECMAHRIHRKYNPLPPLCDDVITMTNLDYDDWNLMGKLDQPRC